MDVVHLYATNRAHSVRLSIGIAAQRRAGQGASRADPLTSVQASQQAEQRRELEILWRTSAAVEKGIGWGRACTP